MTHASQISITAQDFLEFGNLNGIVVEDGQMRVGDRATTFPIMWVANAGEASVSKIDTKTGQELARYWTFFPDQAQTSAWSGPAPSRTAVDSRGNVYVANRHFDNRKPSVMKVLNQDAVDHADDGQLNTSVNVSGEGPIDPDTEMMPLEDTNSTGQVDPEDLRDDRIRWHVTVGNERDLGRSLCIDNADNIWLGMYNGRTYYQLDGDTGELLQGPIETGSHTPYGCLVDGDGMLWSASHTSNLGQLDTNTGEWVATHSHSDSNYGIAVGEDYVFPSNQSSNAGPFLRFNKKTEEFDIPVDDNNMAVTGIALTPNGNLVVGGGVGGITKYTQDGELVWEAPGQEGTGAVRGVVVDSEGDIWAIHLGDHKISKFSGEDGDPLGVFPAGASPYTYSDATGLGTRQLGNLRGVARVVVDGQENRLMLPASVQAQGGDELAWSTSCVAFDEDDIPEGASTTYRARAANTIGQLEFQDFQEIQINGAMPEGFAGRYVELEVQLTGNEENVSERFLGFAMVTEGGDCEQVLAQALGDAVADDSGSGSSSSSSGCSVYATGSSRLDPVLPFLVLAALVGMGLSRWRANV
ncbi:hypothetical protein LRD18_02985 [Halorhodospira halochloris]|nr:hypothetical protein [Halorhodospira halochloris]